MSLKFKWKKKNQITQHRRNKNMYLNVFVIEINDLNIFPWRTIDSDTSVKRSFPMTNENRKIQVSVCRHGAKFSKTVEASVDR